MDKSVSFNDLSFLSADCLEHSAHLIPDMANNKQQPAQTKGKQAPPTQQSGPPAKQQVGSTFTENTTINLLLNESVAEKEADDVRAGTGIEAIEHMHEALLLLNTRQVTEACAAANKENICSTPLPFVRDENFYLRLSNVPLRRVDRRRVVMPRSCARGNYQPSSLRLLRSGSGIIGTTSSREGKESVAPGRVLSRYL